MLKKVMQAQLDCVELFCLENNVNLFDVLADQSQEYPSLSHKDWEEFMTDLR